MSNQIKEIKQIEFKKRCSQVRKEFCQQWFNMWRNKDQSENKSENKSLIWSNLMKEQLVKLQKRDKQDLLAREKKEKRAKDKEFQIKMEKYRESLKRIEEGFQLWNSLQNKTYKYFTQIKRFTINELNSETYVPENICFNIRFAIKEWIANDVSKDLIYKYVEKKNNPKLNTLKGKLGRMYDKYKKMNLEQVKIHNANATHFLPIKSEHQKESGISKKPKKTRQLYNKKVGSSDISKSKLRKIQKSMEDKSKREKRKKVGNDFELKFENLLKKYGLMSSDYLTEQQIIEINKKQTDRYELPIYYKNPDYLFKTPVKINGEYVTWIDCKNCVVLQELMPEYEYEKYLNQINDYCKYYGPGIIVFHRPFFQTVGYNYTFPDMVNHYTCKLNDIPIIDS